MAMTGRERGIAATSGVVGTAVGFGVGSTPESLRTQSWNFTKDGWGHLGHMFQVPDLGESFHDFGIGMQRFGEAIGTLAQAPQMDVVFALGGIGILAGIARYVGRRQRAAVEKA